LPAKGIKGEKEFFLSTKTEREREREREREIKRQEQLKLTNKQIKNK